MTVYQRVWILVGLVVIGFSLAFVIPRSGDTRLSWLKKELPSELGGRVGEKLKISEKELNILAQDTTFARKVYWDKALIGDKKNPDLNVSIVFSGKDINNSIHRPEVCLKAQGWNIISSESVDIDVTLPNCEKISFMELVCKRPRVNVITDDLGNEIDRKIITDVSVQYYTFIGNDKIVSGHYERTWEDIRTRIIKGYDQQWAYMTVSAGVMSEYVSQGYNIGNINSLDVKETKAMLKYFIEVSMPNMLN